MIAAPPHTRYSPAEPVSVVETLRPLARGGNGPSFHRDASGIWIAAHTPLGPGSLHLTAISGGVDAVAYGPGGEWLIDGVPELLGAHDDWSQLDVSGTPVLAQARRRHPGLRLSRNRLVTEMLVPAILEQKVTTDEAWRAWRRLMRRYGTVAPGPVPAGLVVAPSAEVWARIPSWEWHAAGVGPQRADTVMRVVARSRALERTLDRDPAEAATLLATLPGIGAWTAAEVTARAHGNPDAVSVGDYHLAHAVGVALTGHRVDDAGMLELLEPWAGQRQRVLRLLALSGVRNPRYGPKITIQDHRGH